MPVQNMAWNWDTAMGGSDGGTFSIQVNFAPTMAVAQTSMSQSSGALGLIGISQYVTRTDPNGPDQYHNIPFESWPDGSISTGYPPIAYDPMMTSVTATIMVGGGDDQATGSIMVSLWS